MSNPSAQLSLDHIGVIVSDLDAAATRWERLGFKLSPRSPQMGLNAKTGDFEPWATANRCAVLSKGYLELIGIHRPGLTNPWERFLARFEGAHIVALRCASADATYPRLAEHCDDFDPPVQRRRMAPYGDGEREMRFRNIFSRDARVPECRYIVIEHQTPEVLWQPSLMTHPNGALAITTVTLCANAGPDLSMRWHALGAKEVCGPTSVALTSGALQRATQDELAKRFGGISLTPNALAHCEVGVQDLSKTSSWLDAQAISYGRTDTGIWVHPDDANGCIIEFTSRED